MRPVKLQIACPAIPLRQTTTDPLQIKVKLFPEHYTKHRPRLAISQMPESVMDVAPSLTLQHEFPRINGLSARGTFVLGRRGGLQYPLSKKRIYLKMVLCIICLQYLPPLLLRSRKYVLLLSYFGFVLARYQLGC